MKKGILFAAVIGLLLNACNDGHEHAPSITINEPSKAEYEVGDTAWVNVVVTDEHELHAADCWFITRPQNDTLWKLHRHTHSKTININSYYVIGSLPDHQDVDFEVVAENEDGLKSSAKHSFEVHDH